jgi:glycerol-3-phosphate dehydrogenase
VSQADVLVMAVPSHGFRAVLERAAPFVRPWIPFVSLTKGLEEGSKPRMIEELLTGHPAGARATTIARMRRELTVLGVAMGGRPETFAGLAWTGDLIATRISFAESEPPRRRGAGARAHVARDRTRHEDGRRGDQHLEGGDGAGRLSTA